VHAEITRLWHASQDRRNRRRHTATLPELRNNAQVIPGKTAHHKAVENLPLEIWDLVTAVMALGSEC
jgi:hypothetical protein